jgi:aminopeptidase N
VLSNGKLIRQESIEDGQRTEFHWKQEKPHVSYLVTLVAGKFAVVEEKWRGKSITYYVAPGQEEIARQTFGRTPEMLDFFSERFGIDYPWEKYAQVVVEQFTSGGMENTSATTLYQDVMHDARALVDSNPDWLIAHELGHQWWGDLVTCRDWSHLWLNEGFATYCEVLWQEHKRGRDERDYLLYENSKEARGKDGQGRPIVDRRYPSPDTMFDDRAYPKGGWVLHMLRCRMGDADFFHGLKRYGLEYAYSTAETSDFRRVFERLYGVSLERFFYDWTERKGHPKLLIKSTHDADDGFVRIEIKQTQSDEAFHFPLKIELTKAGEDEKPISLTPFLTEKEQTFLLPVKSRPEQIRIDPDFALLADIEEDKSRGWWVAQLAKGPSVPERLRAVEHFAKTPSAADREVLIEALKDDPFYAVRAEAAKALGKTRQADVKEALKLALVDEHPKVRRAAAEAMGSFENDKELASALLAFYQAGDESYYVEAAVIESLAKLLDPPPRDLLERALGHESHRDIIRSKALEGLAKCPDVEVLDLLMSWTKQGRLRSSRMAAMKALAESLKKHDFPKEKQSEAVTLLDSYLKEPGPRIRRAAIAALAEVPQLAQNEKDRLLVMAESDADGRVRTAAGEAVKKIEAANSPGQVQKLQTELDKLHEQYKKLEEQVEKLQAKEK